MPFELVPGFVRHVLTAPELLVLGAFYEMLLPVVTWCGSLFLIGFLVSFSVPKK